MKDGAMQVDSETEPAGDQDWVVCLALQKWPTTLNWHV